MNPVNDPAVPVYATLDALGITYEKYTHPPVFNSEDVAEHWAAIDGTKVKNLFLRNKKGDRHYLVILEVSRQADLRQLVKIVGDDLHPLGQVKDFAPFVAKIKAAGADSVVTGNWGQDLTLLIKAAKDAGLDANFYTYYAVTSGVPTAMAQGVAGKVRVVAIGHNSVPGIVKWQDEYKAKCNDDWYTLQTYNAIAMLSEGMAKAKSVDPVKVAQAMSGLKFAGFGGDVEMRKKDHQLQQGLYISEWRKADAKNPYSVENTGFNFQEVKVIPAFVASTPTSCQMKRPS